MSKEKPSLFPLLWEYKKAKRDASITAEALNMHMREMQAFLMLNPCAIREVDDLGQTPLAFAVFHNLPEIAVWLRAMPECDLNPFIYQIPSNSEEEATKTVKLEQFLKEQSSPDFDRMREVMRNPERTCFRETQYSSSLTIKKSWASSSRGKNEIMSDALLSMPKVVWEYVYLSPPSAGLDFKQMFLLFREHKRMRGIPADYLVDAFHYFAIHEEDHEIIELLVEEMNKKGNEVSVSKLDCYYVQMSQFARHHLYEHSVRYRAANIARDLDNVVNSYRKNIDYSYYAELLHKDEAKLIPFNMVINILLPRLGVYEFSSHADNGNSISFAAVEPLLKSPLWQKPFQPQEPEEHLMTLLNAAIKCEFETVVHDILYLKPKKYLSFSKDCLEQACKTGNENIVKLILCSQYQSEFKESDLHRARETAIKHHHPSLTQWIDDVAYPESWTSYGRYFKGTYLTQLSAESLHNAKHEQQRH